MPPPPGVQHILVGQLFEKASKQRIGLGQETSCTGQRESVRKRIEPSRLNGLMSSCEEPIRNCLSIHVRKLLVGQIVNQDTFEHVVLSVQLLADLIVIGQAL